MSARVPVATRRAVAELVNAARRHGEPVTPLVSLLASEHGVCPASVWNWSRGQHLDRSERKQLSRDQLVRVAQHHGNVKAAHADAVADGFEGTYPTFLRQLHKVDTDYRAAVVDGMKVAIQAGLYNKMSYEPGDVFGFDHTEIPVMVMRPSHDKPFKIWGSFICCWGSGFVFEPVYTEGDGVRGDPTTEAITSLIISVLIGQDFDGHTVGGMPGLFVFDNARAHLAEPVLNGFASLGIRGHAIRPGSPWENGPTENSIGVLEKQVWSKLPGYTHHNPTRYGHSAWDNDELLTVEELIAHTQVGLQRLNREAKVASRDGQTRLEAWLANERMVELVEPTYVRHKFVAATRDGYTVHKSGVSFKGVFYTAPEFHGKVGRTVQLRYLPNDRSFVDVYLDGEFLCTATPTKNLSREQQAKLSAMRRSRLAKSERILKRGAKQTIEAAELAELEAVIADDRPDGDLFDSEAADEGDADIEMYLHLVGDEQQTGHDDE